MNLLATEVERRWFHLKRVAAATEMRRAPAIRPDAPATAPATTPATAPAAANHPPPPRRQGRSKPRTSSDLIQQQSGTHIDIQRVQDVLPDATTRRVTITGGDPHHRELAADLVRKRVEDYATHGSAKRGAPEEGSENAQTPEGQRRQPITDTQGEHTMATLRRRLPTTTTHSTGTHHPTHTAIHRTPPTPRTHRSRQEPRRTLLRRRRDTSEPIPPPPVRSRSRTNILIPTRLLLPPIRFLEGESAAGRSASSGALKQVRFRGGAHSPAFDGRGRSPVSYCTVAQLLNCEHTALADVGVYCAPVRASVCWRLCGPAAPGQDDDVSLSCVSVTSRDRREKKIIT